jgi:retron-type reverse transcriptase
VPADVHEGTAVDYLRRHGAEAAEAAEGNKQQRAKFLSRLLARTADSRNLYLAWTHLAEHGGQAPGVDGVRPRDLDRHEVWAWARAMRQAILMDTYRTDRLRRKLIPKTSGTGTRTLRIPTTADRAIQRAVIQTVQPYLNPRFEDCSMGFRPKKDRLHALALFEKLFKENNFRCVVTEDVKNAFDNFPQQRLLDVVRLRVPDAKFVRLIRRIVATGTGRAVPQGGPLSPFLLNVYLDHFLDKRWRKRQQETPLIRYADDLLLICPDTSTALQAREDLKELLAPAGMPLKGTPGKSIRDLFAGQEADWLGFLIRWGEKGLQYRIGETSWKDLGVNLALLHEEENAPIRAFDLIRGWVSQQGPCYPWMDTIQTYARITEVSQNQGFEEIPSLERIQRLWQRAYARWYKLRKSFLLE